MNRTSTAGKLFRILWLLSLIAMVAACAPTVAPSGGAATGEETAASAEQIQIRFWNHWLAARVELVDKMIVDFESEHPNVDVENVGQPWEDRTQNMLTALASNDPPEVVMATRAEILQLADDGQIVPVTNYIEEGGIDLSAFYEGEIENMRWEGELYSMPMPTGGGITGIVLVNVDMFEAAGKPVVVPETWEELEELGREFTVLDDRGIVTLAANVGTDAGAFFAWLYTNNGQIYSDDLHSVAFNSPEGIETLQWMVDYTNEINGGVQNVLDFFATGQEANEAQPWYNDIQLVNFPNVSIFFHMATIKPEMQWDMGLRPYNSSNPEAKSQGLSGEEFAWGYVIPASVPEEEREAAFQWVKKITYDMNGACWFMQQQSRPSPLKECNEDQMYYDVNPKWDLVLESLERDVSVKILPIHTRIRDIVNQAVEAAMFGDKTPEQALNDAADEAQVLIDEYWSERE
jgi:ABC-type glycerol-3-phosphate transport system substrate-binding protein